MLIKITREGANKTQKWKIVDNIRDVDVSVLLKVPSLKSAEEEEAFWRGVDIVILDLLEGAPGGSVGGAYYRNLLCQRTDGSSFNIIFDTVAYLCNDNGRTVEKIIGCKH